MEMTGIPLMFYASWYKKDVKKHLTKQEKEKLLRKISDISLEKPIMTAGVEFEKKEFPELAPYAHTEKISGLQLLAVMTELFHELYPKQASVIGRGYPSFPMAKKKLKKVI